MTEEILQLMEQLQKYKSIDMKKYNKPYYQSQNRKVQKQLMKQECEQVKNDLQK